MSLRKFNFEDLKVYQKALDFVDVVYRVSSNFPKEETYRLSSQFIRAATSIALNIAEGSEDTNQQFNRFLKIASGSIKECVVCISIAKKQSYIDEVTQETLREDLEELSKMIAGLQKYLREKSTSN